MKRWGSLGLGLLLLLVGVVWCLQGSGLLAGSSMTGDGFWFGMGIVAVLAGLALLATAIKRFRAGRTR